MFLKVKNDKDANQTSREHQDGHKMTSSASSNSTFCRMIGAYVFSRTTPENCCSAASPGDDHDHVNSRVQQPAMADSCSILNSLWPSQTD